MEESCSYSSSILNPEFLSIHAWREKTLCENTRKQEIEEAVKNGVVNKKVLYVLGYNRSEIKIRKIFDLKSSQTLLNMTRTVHSQPSSVNIETRDLNIFQSFITKSPSLSSLNLDQYSIPPDQRLRQFQKFQRSGNCCSKKVNKILGSGTPSEIKLMKRFGLSHENLQIIQKSKTQMFHNFQIPKQQRLKELLLVLNAQELTQASLSQTSNSIRFRKLFRVLGVEFPTGEVEFDNYCQQRYFSTRPIPQTQNENDSFVNESSFNSNNDLWFNMKRKFDQMIIETKNWFGI